jgi:hypothetical protein
MLQALPLGGAGQALLLQQLGLIQQQQALQPAMFQPVQQVQNLPSVPNIVVPTPDPPAFVFTQTVPAAVWTINHNLGTFPSVTLTDPSGNVIMAQVQYVNSNQVVVTFSQPVAGVAYLSV